MQNRVQSYKMPAQLAIGRYK